LPSQKPENWPFIDQAVAASYENHTTGTAANMAKMNPYGAAGKGMGKGAYGPYGGAGAKGMAAYGKGGAWGWGW